MYVIVFTPVSSGIRPKPIPAPILQSAERITPRISVMSGICRQTWF